jgi:hypothetical protein
MELRLARPAGGDIQTDHSINLSLVFLETPIFKWRFGETERRFRRENGALKWRLRINRRFRMALNGGPERRFMMLQIPKQLDIQLPWTIAPWLT